MLEFRALNPSFMGFPGDSVVKNSPAVQEMQVPSLIQEDPLEKEMATCSNILGWEMPWAEEPGGLQSMGLQKTWGLNSNKQWKTRAYRLKGFP